MIDLYGLLAILLAILTSGPPDRVEWHASVGVHLAYGPGGASGAVVIGVDPTPVRLRAAPALYGWRENTCGLSDGWNVWALPHGSCENTLEHELTHIAQRRALGWLGRLALQVYGGEADPPDTARNMPLPVGEGFPLIRFEIPLRWEVTE